MGQVSVKWQFNVLAILPFFSRYVTSGVCFGTLVVQGDVTKISQTTSESIFSVRNCCKYSCLIFRVIFSQSFELPVYDSADKIKLVHTTFFNFMNCPWNHLLLCIKATRHCQIYKHRKSWNAIKNRAIMSPSVKHTNHFETYYTRVWN